MEEYHRFGLSLLEKVEPKFESKNRKALSYIQYASDYGLGNNAFDVTKIW
jgi:hypothetical protein